MFDLTQHNNLTLVIRDQVGRYWPLPDARGLKLTNGTNGYESAEWTLDREFGFAWDDEGLNNQVFVYNGFGDEVFHGRLDSLTPTWRDGVSSLAGSAKGYKDSGNDLKFNGQLVGTPEAQIAALITGSYLRQLISDTTGLIVTGLAAGSTSTDSSGTDDKTVWDVILDICKNGTSAGYKVVPQVWSDRKLLTKAINTVTPTPRYIVDRANVKSISLSRSLSDTYSHVLIRYKDSVDGTLQRTYWPTGVSPVAVNMGVDYTGGGTITNMRREYLLDLTNTYPDGTSLAVAQQAGTAVWNEITRVRNSGSSITIDQDYVIFDVLEGQEIPNWKVRGDDWIQINGFTPWPTDAGTGTSAGDTTITSIFLMTAAEYDVDTSTLTISPESAGNLAGAIVDKLAALGV